MKKLGVVVPVYNAEPYLENCIASILGQSYKNLEVVLVNDGSSDNSGVICDKYAQRDSRVHVIHEKNMGPNAARYNGAISVQCDYLTFVDPDDWIDSNLYKKMSVYMDEDTDVIMFQIIRYCDDMNQTHYKYNYKAGKYDREKIEKIIFPDMLWNREKYTFGITPSLCNKIIKRNLVLEELEKAKDLNIFFGEDVAVIYPLFLKIDSLIISDQYLYYYRQRKAGELPSYIKDDKYHERALALCNYLKYSFHNNRNLYIQVEYYYLYLTEIRLRVYGDYITHKKYMFPFHIVPAKSRIILYGAAEVGQQFFEQNHCINYCTVVAWIDRNYLNYQNFNVVNVETLQHIGDYDFIVIAVEMEGTAKQITAELVSMGIEKEKIIWSID